MSDPLTWSPISLGRWFGTRVRVHYFLLLYVFYRLLMSLLSPGTEGPIEQVACRLGLLLLVLVLHELGHAITAWWLGCDQEDVHLWPLGNLVGPPSGPRSSDHFLVAMAGLVVSGALFLGVAVSLSGFS